MRDKFRPFLATVASPIVGARARYERVTHLLRRVSMPALRIALGVIFVWFGTLKIFDVTPVARLIRGTVPFVEAPAWLVPAMGGFEVCVGLWLIVGVALRLLLPAYVAHMLATFGVLIVQPAVAFHDGNPLILTAEGEFVVKNLVLLTAGVAVCTTSRRRRTGPPPPTKGDHTLAA